MKGTAFGILILASIPGFGWRQGQIPQGRYQMASGVSLAEAPGFPKAPGGAPANVAIAGSRLGGESAFVGKFGNDEFGRMLAAILEENGVSSAGVRFDAGARTALAFVTLRADGEREFMFYRNPSADMLLTSEELDSDLIGSVGEDEFGRMPVDFIAKEGVDVSAVVFDAVARTALAFITLKKNGEREFMFYHNPSADMLLKQSELNMELIHKANIFHYGSISLISEPVRSVHLAAMDAAKEAGILLPSADTCREGIKKADFIKDEGKLREALKSSSEEVTPRISDGEEVAVTLESQRIKNLNEDDCAGSALPLPNVISRILAKVIKYCRKYFVTAPKPKPDDVSSEDAEFFKVDQATLLERNSNKKSIDPESQIDSSGSDEDSDFSKWALEVGKTGMVVALPSMAFVMAIKSIPFAFLSFFLYLAAVATLACASASYFQAKTSSTTLKCLCLLLFLLLFAVGISYIVEVAKYLSSA